MNPFKVGDFVSCSEGAGIVEKVPFLPVEPYIEMMTVFMGKEKGTVMVPIAQCVMYAEQLSLLEEL